MQETILTDGAVRIKRLGKSGGKRQTRNGIFFRLVDIRSN